ncbi:MAG: TolC family outer membrane protein [Alcanivoracaceae bacterium]|nr:TolC family outer membrane protein [Alcanivoracaceae bacterium]
MKKSYLKFTCLALSISALSCSALAADLSEIFKQSELHDPLLSSAKHTLNASTEGKKQAFSVFLPQVTSSFGKDFGKNKRDNTLSGALPSTTSRSESWRISISQALYDHANYQNYKISKLQILKSTADYEVAFQDFIMRVAQSYFNVLGAKDNLVFSKAEEKAIQRQLDQAEQRFEVGLAAITDVHEARARYDSARAAVILADNQLQDANEALFEISQRYYAELTPAPDDLDFSSFKLNAMETYQEQGEKQSPELISSQINMDIAERQISVNKSGHYPTLALSFSRSNSFSPGTTGTQFDPETGAPIQFDSGDTTLDSNSVSLSLNVPIYSGGRTSSQVRQASHNHRAAMDRYEQIRRGTVRGVRNAYHGTIASQSSVQARNLAMVSAQSGLEATEAGYEVGTRTIVDVLNSQRSLYQAQRDYSQAKYDYFIQYLGLKKAAGNLTEQDIAAINKILEIATE